MARERDSENVVREKSYRFSLAAIRLYQDLVRNREFVLSKQFLRSATSIGANVEEAACGQSRRDFLSKMSIASKEAREAKYWLRLLSDSGYIERSSTEAQTLFEGIDELIRILTAIVKTTARDI